MSSSPELKCFGPLLLATPLIYGPLNGVIQYLDLECLCYLVACCRQMYAKDYATVPFDTLGNPSSGKVLITTRLAPRPGKLYPRILALTQTPVLFAHTIHKSYLQHVKSLCLFGVWAHPWIRMLQAASDAPLLPRLTDLTLSGFYLTQQHFGQACAFLDSPCLQGLSRFSLGIMSTRIDDHETAEFAERVCKALSRCPNLKSFSLDCTSAFNAAENKSIIDGVVLLAKSVKVLEKLELSVYFSGALGPERHGDLAALYSVPVKELTYAVHSLWERDHAAESKEASPFLGLVNPVLESLVLVNEGGSQSTMFQNCRAFQKLLAMALREGAFPYMKALSLKGFGDFFKGREATALFASILKLAEERVQSLNLERTHVTGERFFTLLMAMKGGRLKLRSLNLAQSIVGGCVDYDPAEVGRTLGSCCLESLDLSHAIVPSAVMDAFFEALKDNTTLKTLNLKRVLIRHNKSGHALGRVLEHNVTLRELNLAENYIDCFPQLREALKKNVGSNIILTKAVEDGQQCLARTAVL